MTLKIKYPSQQPSITSIIVAINPPIDENIEIADCLKNNNDDYQNNYHK